jgi:hypothetical protein
MFIQWKRKPIRIKPQTPQIPINPNQSTDNLKQSNKQAKKENKNVLNKRENGAVCN